MVFQPDDGIDPEILKLMQHKIRRLVGQYGFTPGDVDEIFVNVKTKVLRAMEKHKSHMESMRPYLTAVVKNEIATSIESATARRRDRRRERPLESTPDRFLASREPTTEQASLAMDMDSAMEHGDDDMRRLVALFRSGHSFAEMERETGYSRQKVRSIWTRVERLLREKLGPDNDDDQ